MQLADTIAIIAEGIILIPIVLVFLATICGLIIIIWGDKE